MGKENEVIYPSEKIWLSLDRTPIDRPSAPQAYQCKITQSTDMVTQMQLEVILAGNRIYSHRRLVSRDNKRVNKEENGKRKLFLDPCCLKY